MQAVHDSELQAMQVSLKKAQKELGYKDEEVRRCKETAMNATEKFEKCDRIIKHLENTVKEKDQENDRLEQRIVDFEVRIGKINSEKQELSQEAEKQKKEAQKKEQEKVELGKVIEDLKMTIEALQRDVKVRQAEIEEREEAMKQM